jgi:hypothetical protein
MKGAFMKHLLLLALILLVSGFAVAQKVDAALVVGGSFVSDTKGTFSVPEFPFLNANFKSRSPRLRGRGSRRPAAERARRVFASGIARGRDTIATALSCSH